MMIDTGKALQRAEFELMRLVSNALTGPVRLPNPFRPSLRDQVAGKTVLITGASSGIGRGLAARVAAAGAITVVTARRTAELDQLVAEIRGKGGSAFAITSDLSTAEGIEKLADDMLVEFGAPDILVNNAGRSIRRPLNRSAERLHDFERTMRVNYFGAVGLILRLLPDMREKRDAQIITSSSVGTLTYPPQFSAYVGSKTALDAVMRIAAIETLSDGVVFTKVHLPMIDTAMAAPEGLHAYTKLPVETAVDMMVDAIIRRPDDVQDLLGIAGAWLNLLAPGLVKHALHAVHHRMPPRPAPSPDRRAQSAALTPQPAE
ncbi:SDR family NAD(P)-dependent oxidoreductase [Nocardia neocaledoniensis]|uniref:SDR family NAD(P)-dependent oxidoreductase n=1 Tax=Nocardia neocaledoniensis TaxID=236511 RepID=UPI0024570B32|nr:SDR family NAD(P)-dependent oxidoreductase [Nocardia neocaledoniensis]